MPRFDRSHTDDLAAYIKASPTPYHACAEAGRRLETAGFVRLGEADEWPADPGGYYTVRDGSIIAWRINDDAYDAFRIFGAHTDTPTFKVKPRPDTGSAGWKQVAVEVYGGVPHQTWLDRDLSVAGRLVMRDGTEVLVHVDRPLLRVPRLAIHLDRGANEGQKLNAQSQLTPIWGLGEPYEGEFIEFIAAEAGVDAADVFGHDLFTVALDEPAYLGKDEELFAAWRLDNLTSTHAGLAALIAAEDTGTRVPVLASFNYEEIGSMTYSGAQSPFLESVLHRLMGDDFETYARAIAASAMMSSDTGNAIHPNYQEKHEPGHRPIPGKGPMIKVSANQRYASGAEEQALFRRSAEAAGIPWQTYVNRNDIPGGTTIGPISGTQLGMLTVDVGLPILSMHSARELCGAEDPGLLADLALGLFTH
ncbi:M18 family aminopeptidase [Glycomyces algeriensis]|uniref:M18 family aminopeptidase n=1 Tax=Glycomyces algeriensis TaxID=256037 RepID=A0A9W6LJ41_9ACTN|nr:M18 family aminopeptidase [Glycomyces algeriensis]MDA1369016.1 M18 family aminopeptidase [Glycomyces algeriensis]MDR7352325.1 aspartyl aminopeptidase [Glycomyces algeriensis]GLI45060.1 putative M18 family aminopeptidase 2 [Glycomyces algeriensis]